MAGRIELFGAGAALPRQAPAARNPSGASFAEALGAAQSDLKLSRHAQKRIDRRELDLDAPRMERLNSAISRAAEKGARNSVVMLDGLAVVVDVRERTVVTAMSAGGGGGEQKVFTNVDSVVIA